MKPKVLLAGVAVVTVLGIGAAISWGASSQPAPAVWSHDVVAGPAEPGAGTATMHRGLGQADIDEMVEICEKAMQRMHDDMMGNADMMDDDADMMGGGMMGGGMMGGGTR